MYIVLPKRKGNRSTSQQEERILSSCPETSSSQRKMLKLRLHLNFYFLSINFFLLTYDFLSLSQSPYYQSFMYISLIVSFWQMSFSTWYELFNKPIRSANLLSWILYFNRCFKPQFFRNSCVIFYQIPKPITFKLQVKGKFSPWCFKTHKEFDDKPNPC